jgi:hypothetical protein
VLEDFGARLGVESDVPMDPDVLLAAEVLKVRNSEEADVGSVVPLVKWSVNENVMSSTSWRGRIMESSQQVKRILRSH